MMMTIDSSLLGSLSLRVASRNYATASVPVTFLKNSLNPR
jgi:hypothetical protein